MRWFLDRLALAMVAGAALWVVVPSSLFIHPISLTIDAEGISRFTRELPLGEVRARWHSEITLIDGEEFECNSGDWQFANYQQVPGNTVTYGSGDWADACFAAGPPFYITTTRQVLLFNVIPLRPMVTRTDILGENGLSRAGIVQPAP